MEVNNVEWKKACTEVIEILKYYPEECLKKIPKKILDGYKNNRDTGYEYKIDESKPLDEQNILKETKGILAVLYRDYLASQEEKAEILKKEKAEFLLIEEDKRKKYNPDNIFKK